MKCRACIQDLPNWNKYPKQSGKGLRGKCLEGVVQVLVEEQQQMWLEKKGLPVVVIFVAGAGVSDAASLKQSSTSTRFAK